MGTDSNGNVSGTTALSLEEEQIAGLDIVVIYPEPHLILRSDIARHRNAVAGENVVDEPAAVESPFGFRSS